MKRKKSNKMFPDPTRSMCVGVWWGRGEPVIWVLSKGSRSFLNSSKQPLPALVGTWQIWAFGFWQRWEHQEFSKNPFQFLRERRWRRLEFLGCLPRVRLMKNRDRRRPQRSSLWKARGHQSSGGVRPGTIQTSVDAGRNSFTHSNFSPPELGSNYQNGHWTGGPAAFRFTGDPMSPPDNRSCSWTEHRLDRTQTGIPTEKQPHCTALDPGGLYTVHHYPKSCRNFIHEKMRETFILKGRMKSFANLLEQHS